MGAINATCLPACVPSQAPAECDACGPKQRDTRDLRAEPRRPSSCGPFECGAFREPVAFKAFVSAREARIEANRLWRLGRMDAAYDAFSQALTMVEGSSSSASGGVLDLSSINGGSGSPSRSSQLAAATSATAVAPGSTSLPGGARIDPAANAEEVQIDPTSLSTTYDATFQAELFDELADFLFENHPNPDPAIALYDKAAHAEPTVPLRWYKKGVALQMQSKYNLAQQNFEKALAIDPKHRGARFNLGVVHFNTVQYTTALEMFTGLYEEAEKLLATQATATSSTSAGTILASQAVSNWGGPGADTGGSSTSRINGNTNTGSPVIDLETALQTSAARGRGGATNTTSTPGASARTSMPATSRNTNANTVNIDELVNLLILIADCHEKLESPQKAAEFLHKALQADPQNRTAAKQLEDIQDRLAPPGDLRGRSSPHRRRTTGAGHILLDAETVTVGCYSY
ncbi:unnamed protein product [Amoebophrya sp. A120]|nr:unnamed protein product [Amoebophrya sp. A120]|eukprot:GSA120T00018205001.1